MNAVTNSGAPYLGDMTGTSAVKPVKQETAGIDPNWMRRTAEAMRTMSKQAYEQNVIAADQVDPNVPRLSKEQIHALRQTYDPKHMDLSAYKAMLDDLIQIGALSENEKKYLTFSDTLPGPSGLSISIAPETWMEPPYEFDACRGNVYELARFHSLREWCVRESHQRFQSAQSKSFAKLLNILNQMGIR